MARSRMKVAAVGATLLALGGLAGVAISAVDRPQTVATRSAAPVEVRTQVIRRTVHVVRHEKPRHRSTHATAAAAAAPPPAVAPAPRVVAVTSPPAQRADVPKREPLRTRSSGSTGREREDGGEAEHSDSTEAEGADD